MNLVIKIFAFLLLIGIGCKERLSDDLVTPKPDCLAQIPGDSIINVDSMIEWSSYWPRSGMPVIHQQGCNYRVPVFNPRREAEIAYVAQHCPSGKNGLRVHDFCTGENRLLLEGPVGYLDWSSTDWLIFEYGRGAKHIFKIKSNGDSLTQLTTHAGYNNAPRWNTDGDRFIYWNGGGGDPGVIVSDIMGNVTDNILIDEYGLGYYHWVNDNIYHAGRGNSSYSMGVYSTSSNENKHLVTYQAGSEFYSGHTLSDFDVTMDETAIIASGHAGVIRYDLLTGESKILLPDTPTSTYHGGAAISPNGEYLIIVRTDTWKIADWEGESDTYLALCKLDGSGLRKLSLPE